VAAAPASAFPLMATRAVTSQRQAVSRQSGPDQQ